jgi:hypothetical protein
MAGQSPKVEIYSRLRRTKRGLLVQLAGSPRSTVRCIAKKHSNPRSTGLKVIPNDLHFIEPIIRYKTAPNKKHKNLRNVSNKKR